MARAVIGGRAYDIAPFRLRELRRAAPFIDRVAARGAAGGAAGIEAAAQTAFDMLGVLAAGIEGATPERLEAEASLDELAALHTSFDQVLAEAGLTRPERDPVGETRPAADPWTPSPPPAPAVARMGARADSPAG